MTPPVSFFHEPAIRRLLERGALAACSPLSIHYLSPSEEFRTTSVGGCAACRLVCEDNAGRQECRESRRTHGQKAISRGLPQPFLCHMGFVCVSSAVLPEQDSDRGYVLTLGPFNTAEAPLAMLEKVEQGLQRLGLATNTPVKDLVSDVQAMPKGSVPAVAEWLSESLSMRYAASLEAATAKAPPAESPQDKRRRSQRAVRRPANSCAAEVAAALAGGNHAQARTMVSAAFSEGAGRASAGTIRTRAVALAAEVIGSAETAGMATQDLWNQLPGFVAGLNNLPEAQLVNQVVHFLAPLKKAASNSGTGPAWLPKLNAILASELADEITLHDIARRIGVNHSTISHGLRRRFKLTYSQYVGRLRVDKSKELLCRTELSVAEISKRVGVRDPSNFARLFRLFEGVAPVTYRQQHIAGYNKT